MKHRSLNILCAVLLSFCLSFGSLGCMVTALELGDPPELLALGCLLCGIVTAACLCLRRSGRAILIIGGAWLLLVIPSPVFREQLLDLCRRAMTIYNRAYGVRIPQILLDASADGHLIPLLLVGGMVSLGVCWAVQKQYSHVLAFFMSTLPMAACTIVTDTVPDLMFILIWLFGLILLALTHMVRLRDGTQGDRLTLMMAAPIAAALALLALLIPREGYAPPLRIPSFNELIQSIPPLFTFSGSNGSDQAPGDLSEQVDLSQADSQPTGTDVVMELRSDHTGTVYLKGRDFDLYDGLSWQSDPNRTESGAIPGEFWLVSTGTLQVHTLIPFQQQFIPYYTITEAPAQGGAVPNGEDLTDFTYSCYALRPGWERYWAEVYLPGAPDVDERYLELPPVTAALAKRLLKNAGMAEIGDTVSLALRIEQYVRQCAEYDLEPQTIPSGQEDFAIWFLTQADSGYCVHFATAATVLLRASGIPARYVEGYLSQTQAGEISPVQEKAAHAWVEYYVNGVGWVVLDPTPSDDEPEEPVPTEPTSPSTSPTEPTMPEPTETDPPRTEPSEPEPSAPSEPGSSAPPATTPTEPPAAQEPDPGLPRWLTVSAAVLAAAALLWLAAMAQGAIRRTLRQNRMDRGTPKAKALARFREARRICRILDLPTPAHLQELAEKACFSQYGLTEQELARMGQFLTYGISQIRLLSWPKRLFIRLFWAIY